MNIIEITRRTRTTAETALENRSVAVTQDGLSVPRFQNNNERSIVTIGIDKFTDLVSTYDRKTTARATIVARIYEVVDQKTNRAKAEENLLTISTKLIKAFGDDRNLDTSDSATWQRKPRLDKANFIVGDVAFEREIEID